MNSTHFRNLYGSLLAAIIAEIKEKIGRSHIKVYEIEKSLFVVNPKIGKYEAAIQVKSFSFESIILEDGTEIVWEEIISFNDLHSILVYIEDWLKSVANDSFLIRWSISDFEDCASNIEESTNNGRVLLFDRSKFLRALKILEDHHDYNLGINWDDIKFHLNEYCRI